MKEYWQKAGGMMKKRAVFKMIVDILMTILLPVLMARQMTGDSVHEWLGAGMFVLWMIHHILNRNWYQSLFRGKYTSMRILQTITNAAVMLCMLCMLGLIVSGIMLSREVFDFLPISGGIAQARIVHMLAAFWGYVWMGVHLGLHWGRILHRVCRTNAEGFADSSKKTHMVLQGCAVLIAGYGLYAFLKNQFLSYMFLKTHFVFFDYEKPALLFFMEYAVILGMFIFLAYYGAKGIRKVRREKK